MNYLLIIISTLLEKNNDAIRLILRYNKHMDSRILGVNKICKSIIILKQFLIKYVDGFKVLNKTLKKFVPVIIYIKYTIIYYNKYYNY